MADPTPEALKRLGELVTARRRDDLGIRQDQLAYGPSTTTMTQIETGEKKVSDLSYRRLEQSLGWAEGDCLRVLAGEDPIVVVPKPPHRLDPRRDFFRGPPRDFDAEMAAVPVVKVDTSPLAELLLARRTEPEERSPEQWALIHAADERRDREAAAVRRATDEAPLIELVADGQDLAAMKADEDVSAYVRKVESYVVGRIGIERLTETLDGRAMQRTLNRAVQSGVLDAFMEEIDRLRGLGVEGRELQRRVSEWLDGALSSDDGESGSAADDVDAAASEVVAELDVDGVDDDGKKFGRPGAGSV